MKHLRYKFLFVVLAVLAVLAGVVCGRAQNATMTYMTRNGTSGGFLERSLTLTPGGIIAVAPDGSLTTSGAGGNVTFSRVNIGGPDYGLTYNPEGSGQLELRFPGGAAAFFETGSPLRPWMYFPGTIQADYIVGAGEFTSINAGALVGTIPPEVMQASESFVLAGWGYQSAEIGIPWLETGPLSVTEPTPPGARYWPAVFVEDGGAEMSNTLVPQYLSSANATDALGAARLNAASNTFTGNLTVEGTAQIGDSTGDVVRLAGTSAASAGLTIENGQVVSGMNAALSANATSNSTVMTRANVDGRVVFQGTASMVNNLATANNSNFYSSGGASLFALPFVPSRVETWIFIEFTTTPIAAAPSNFSVRLSARNWRSTNAGWITKTHISVTPDSVTNITGNKYLVRATFTSMHADWSTYLANDGVLPLLWESELFNLTGGSLTTSATAGQSVINIYR